MFDLIITILRPLWSFARSYNLLLHLPTFLITIFSCPNWSINYAILFSNWQRIFCINVRSNFCTRKTIFGFTLFDSDCWRCFTRDLANKLPFYPAYDKMSICLLVTPFIFLFIPWKCSLGIFILFTLFKIFAINQWGYPFRPWETFRRYFSSNLSYSYIRAYHVCSHDQRL